MEADSRESVIKVVVDQFNIDQKGIFLGNPLRFLDCMGEASWSDIHRSYNEITRIRLKVNSKYTPKNDPFSKIDPITIDLYNARNAFEALRNPEVRAASKLLYPSQRDTTQTEMVMALRSGAFDRVLKAGDNIYNAGDDATISIAEYVVLFCGPRKRRDIETLKRPLRRFSVILTQERIKRFISHEDDLSQLSLEAERIFEMSWKLILSDYWNRGVDSVMTNSPNIGSDRLTAIWDILEGTPLLPFSNQIVSKVLDQRSETCIRPLVHTLQLHADQVSRLDTLHDYMAISKDIVETTQEQLKAPINLRKVYSEKFNQLQYEFDDLAGSLRNYAIEVNNKWDDYSSSLKFVKWAQMFANAPDLKERLEEDYCTIQTNESASQERETEMPQYDISRMKTGDTLWNSVSDFFSFVPMVFKIAVVFAFVGLLFKQCETDNPSVSYQNQNTKYKTDPSEVSTQAGKPSAGNSSPNNRRGLSGTNSGFGSVSGRTYVVESGDTLWDIARKYGLSVNALRSINNLSRDSRIYVGQTLIVGDAQLSEAYVSELGAEIDRNKLRISSLELQISVLDEQLEQSLAELTNMESSLQEYSDLYDAGYESYADLFNQLYVDYEPSLEAHNAKVRERQRLFSEYKQLWEQTDNKIEEYNAAIQQR